MSKYRNKSIIEAKPYEEGMEDGWSLDFSSNMYSYYKIFKTKEEVINFINNDEGRKDADEDDLNYPIIYEDPIPYVMYNYEEYSIFEGDYIVFSNKGKYVINKTKFEEEWEVIHIEQ